ncbi:MAG: hypothetical protein MSH58_00185 [Clostridiales bacterium]|nr:hypothetical protein [Clostridiales bacterium]
MEEVQISSFRVTPFGANISYIPKPDTVGITLKLWQDTDDEIYAVMKDGSRIKLDLTGADATILQAQAPIVLSQLGQYRTEKSDRYGQV